MKKTRLSSSIITIITLTAVFCAAYYFLLQDNYLRCSIASIIHMSHRLEPTQHLVVLGLLPIYIATVIFGAAISGIYIGRAIQQHLKPNAKKNLLRNKPFLMCDIIHNACGKSAAKYSAQK